MTKSAARPIRITHVIVALNPGGAELMMSRLIASQSDNPRYRHRVVSLSDKGSVGALLESRGVEVRALGMKGLVGLPSLLARLIRDLRNDRPDIVQCWMYHADLIGGVGARIARVPAVIWGVRIADIGRQTGIPRATAVIRALCATLSRILPDRIVYVAQTARARHEAIGYAPEGGIVIPNGYVLPPQRDRTILRRKLGVSDDIFLVGSAGRFSAQKDPKSFIDAAAILAERHADMHFVMIGRGYTDENIELVEWLKRAGLRDKVHLLGERRDLPDLLGGLDVFCLHSVEEGFPNVVAEAMATGVPCVATDVGDARILIGDTGLVLPASRPDVLADAIGRLRQLAPEEREDMGARARRRVADNYSLDLASRRFAQLYEGLAAGGNPTQAAQKPAGTG